LIYIGPLSRFNFEVKSEKEIDLLFILSGPEPMRSKFEEEVIKHFGASNKKIVLIRGKEESGPLPIKSKLENLEIHHLLGESQLKDMIENTKVIVCRSGYSSIMDYYQLPIVKYIIATPGQTEQEYLADYLNHRFGFKKIKHLSEID
jgi:UDP-N-acetylglucosamine transferase subunit ALG13